MLARSAPESKKLAHAVRQDRAGAAARCYVPDGEERGMTTNNVLDTMVRWAADGEPFALATVVETRRSAPRPVGAKLAVDTRGAVAGAVSGGCVEGAVIEAAEQVLAGGPPRLLRYGIDDQEAYDVGLPCGGEIAVWVEAHDPAGPQARFTALAREGRRAAVVTVLAGGPRVGAKLLVAGAGAGGGAGGGGAAVGGGATAPAAGERHGTLGDPALDAAAAALAREALWSERSELQTVAGATLFVDVAAPPPRLIVVGAVDIAVALTAVAALAGWRPFVIDPRSRFATAERFPAAERTIAAWPDRALAELGPLDRATAICVLTHDPKLDDAALRAALASEAGYIGAMGSRRAQEQRHDRLLAAGVPAAALERIAGPIGLDLGGRTAAETALSIMSEIVAVRHGRRGGRLVDAQGAIHEAVVA
jgi:xanthine dehydrogenase accessory factor